MVVKNWRLVAITDWLRAAKDLAVEQIRRPSVVWKALKMIGLRPYFMNR